MGNVPWFWPGLAISVLLGIVAAARVSRSLAIGRVHAAVLVVAVGIIVAATLTPLRVALTSGAVGSGVCDLSRIGPPSLRDLVGLTDATLNLVLFAPLGAAIGLLPRTSQRVALLVVAVAGPFAIETIQLLAPILARGCQSADVVDNLTGLVAGLLIGIALRKVAGDRTAGRSRPGRSTDSNAGAGSGDAAGS
ncbi:MAG TPA: VanZ family protein [Candidatus Deferrimicrobium sp.]|nr:VanZ family protein [Candidatus Deferrimicrobium sp.]